MKPLLIQNITRIAVACVTASLVLIPMELRADEKTWTGAADGSWLNGANWSPSALVSEFDDVVFDASSIANLNQTLDQNWSIAGLRVLDAPGPITIAPGAENFVLTNTAGIDMSAATVDLTILADYHPVNHGSLHVAAGRTLTLSNIVANINTAAGATIGAGTVRILGEAQRLTQNLNSITVIVDGGSVNANSPLQLAADSDATVTVVVTNNGSVNVTSGNAQRILLGAQPNLNSTNHFILDGGTVHVTGSTGSSANGIIVGQATSSIGILDINDGFIDLSHRTDSNQRSFLRVANGFGTTGIVNLNSGGLIRAPRIESGDGTAIFNFNGGTFAASLLNPFFEGFAEVNLLEGGGTIDTEAELRTVTIPVSVSGPGGLNKVGLGTLTLSGPDNSYAGPTVVHAGVLNVTLPMSSSTLTLAPDTALGVTVGSVPDVSWAASDSMTLEGDNILTFAYGPESEPSPVLLNTSTLTASGTIVIDIEGAGWPEGTIRLIDYEGSIAGDGIFVLGTLPVGLNAHLTNNTSTTSIDLVVSSSVNELAWWGFGVYGDSGGGLWDIAASLNWNDGTSAYNEYGSGDDLLGDSVRFIPDVNTLVEVAATVRPSSVVISNLNNFAYTFMGPGKISDPTSLVKDGNHNLSEVRIEMQNDYTGGTFLQRGRLVIGTDDALPTDGLVYVGSPGNGAFLVLNGFNQTIGGLVSTGSGAGNRRVLNSGFTHVTLTINVAAGETNIYAHTMGNNVAAPEHEDNDYSIIKTGPGLQTIGNSFYNGSTLISDGTLLFNGGNMPLPGDITVQSGAAAGGSGTVAAPITVQAGGRLEPGNLAIGTLTVNNTVTLQGETVMELNRASAQNSDRLAATAVVLGGTLTVTNIGEPLEAGDAFALFSGTLSGSFSEIVLPSLPAGLEWNTANLELNGTIAVESLPMPTFNTPSFSDGNIVLSGSGGVPGAAYHVLTATDVAAPLENWTQIAINNFDSNGEFSESIPVDPSEPHRFYLLLLP